MVKVSTVKSSHHRVIVDRSSTPSRRKINNIFLSLLARNKKEKKNSPEISFFPSELAFVYTLIFYFCSFCFFFFEGESIDIKKLSAIKVSLTRPDTSLFSFFFSFAEIFAMDDGRHLRCSRKSPARPAWLQLAAQEREIPPNWSPFTIPIMLACVVVLC